MGKDVKTRAWLLKYGRLGVILASIAFLIKGLIWLAIAAMIALGMFIH